MATTADLKNGMYLKYNGDICVVVQFQHVKPGKGPAFVRTKLKSLTTGRTLENTFNAGVKIETANIERRPYQYLYAEESGYNFMHCETFEQIIINKEMIATPQFMKEGQGVEVVYDVDNDTPLTCELPPIIEFKVTYTEPGARGDSSSTTVMKPATIETGAEISVPLFINEGDIIRVDTRDGSYYERVK